MSELLTISMITYEALRVLENNLCIAKLVNRQYDDKFGVEGAKIGYTVNARKPVRYVVTTGQALSLQEPVETSVPITLDTQDHVDFQFSSADMLLSVDDFSDRFLTPAIAALANKIDSGMAQLYTTVGNFVGTPGTTPNALLTYLLAGVDLNNEATPMDGQRSIVLTPLMEATIVDALKGLFQSASQIAEQYTKGKMGTAVGFSWYMDQNVYTHTVGALGGTPLVNGSNQTGASVITDGWTAAAATRLLLGDCVTFGGCFQVNPQSRLSTGLLRKFAVTADTASDGSGNMTIPISPAIVIAGAYQNCSAAPTDNGQILTFGAVSSTQNAVTPQGMAFHRDAFTLVTADLPLPNGVDKAARASDKQLGISLRIIRQYDINTDNWPCRVDVLWGKAALRPELASRICG